MSKIFQIKKILEFQKQKRKVQYRIKFVLFLLVGELVDIVFFLITGRPTPIS